MLTATGFADHASRHILLGAPLGLNLLEPLPALRAAARPRMTGAGCRGISPSALLRRLLSIGRGQLDLKLMDLVPLGIRSLALRYRQERLQPAPR